MTITAALVKDLRTKTGAGMMDCKKALVEVSGDFEAAVDWLRTKGLAAAAKKAGRVAAEGLTAVSINGLKGAAIEINSETDFVAKNETFQGIVKEVSELAVTVDDIDSLKAVTTKSGKSVEDEIIANIGTIGEHLNLRRMQSLSVNDGVIAPYIHNAVSDNMGKIAVLVALESTGDKVKLMETAKQIAMHIAAARPECLNKESVNPEIIQREKDIFTEQTRESGKPDNIIEKMIEGRIRKFLEEIVLLDQVFVIDGKTKISDVVANLAKELGTPVALKSYIRFELGEGIEKEEKNFADEVAAVAKN
ncbi:MAG: translation elongation factor Ts [Rickettsiaceae bacterium]|nr:translation elongation factor Ts [Rickettsiaceae bacterium]MDP4832616.1 translation elongation factor Ts [Rickettsiaceae bacterium]MDP5021238.1 translation elongation factor Ts [Rickettsiaceae bacterium]MDP5083188.1 translation elongation factor Ts [Rickettsiaceae bacterium]